MITLSTDFKDIYRPSLSLMHILCLKAAFEGSALEEDMWVQSEDGKTIGAVAKNGGRLYLFSPHGDTAELKEFINTVGFSEIFTEKATAKRLGLKTEKEYEVLLRKSVKSAEFDPFGVSLSPLYDGLKFGEDGDISLPSFKDFAADISHRLRHGAAVAALNENSAALGFKCEKGLIINGISVKRELRGRNLGRLILSELLSYSDGDVLAAAEAKNTEFYIKNGFEVIDKAVIAR